MEEEKLRKRPGGRNPLKGLKRKRYKYYLNKDEYSALYERLQDSPYQGLSEYVRALILDENKSAKHINPVIFLRAITELTRQVGKLGNNVNQLAYHANIMARERRLKPEMADALDKKIEEYAILQREIIYQLKSIMKG